MTETLPILAIIISIVGILFQHFAVIAGIKERLSAIEIKTDLFWHYIEEGVVKMLKTYPTNLEKDVLLDKMLKNELSLGDAQRLRSILKGEMEERAKTDALAYVLALGRIEQIIFDLKPRRYIR